MDEENSIFFNGKLSKTYIISIIVLAFLLFGTISLLLIGMSSIHSVTSDDVKMSGFRAIKEFGSRGVLLPSSSHVALGKYTAQDFANASGGAWKMLQAGLIFGTILVPIPAIMGVLFLSWLLYNKSQIAGLSAAFAAIIIIIVANEVLVMLI